MLALNRSHTHARNVGGAFLSLQLAIETCIVNINKIAIVSRYTQRLVYYNHCLVLVSTITCMSPYGYDHTHNLKDFCTGPIMIKIS